jgi:uncharacterized protein YlzI (FlbEa/FlbD family)
MKVAQKQQNAKNWSKGLNKLNEAQAGQVAVTYKDNDGKKRTGYMAITDLSLLVGDKEITLGALLTEMLNLNVETLNKVKTIAQGVASSGNDLLIVKENEEGFINQIVEFNSKIDLVIAKQAIPIDYNKGYYYVKDGLIVFDENKKLEIYPDFV